jgi:ubiquinone/menaquinone biosynthesis C-methylase UbiE
VSARYAAGAAAVEDELCCPVDYDPRYLKVLPDEILERDYGCGDPSRWLREGETVLDLGAGGGKICYIASQVVGPSGRVVGVDMTAEMLDLARRHREDVAGRIGWDNVEFRHGRIEDLALDLDRFDAWLAVNPVGGVDGWRAAEQEAERMRSAEPMVPDASIDVVVSNCVLNLVAPSRKRQLFRELHRVLRDDGRAVISDIVAEREVPLAMQQDEELWSGCISGAFEEQAFGQAFLDAGFAEYEVLERQEDPWRVVGGIAFRSVTVAAYRGSTGPRMTGSADTGASCSPTGG